MPSWWSAVLTWHSVEQPLATAVVGVQVLAVGGPVHVRDEAAGAHALPHLLVALHHAVDVHRVVVGAHGQVAPVGGVLQLVDGLFAIFDVHDLSHVSGRGERRGRRTLLKRQPQPRMRFRPKQ